MQIYRNHFKVGKNDSKVGEKVSARILQNNLMTRCLSSRPVSIPLQEH